MSDGSLSLSAVLAEEYEALHGALPPDFPRDGDEETRLAAVVGLIHGLPRKRTALCLSGGGIRSATFGLGVLQGLAQHDLLDQFDYLSTVSGGGYIGSWLTAWIHRHPAGLTGVEAELKEAQSSRLEPEPAAVRHLRAFGNYLNPRSGLFSADSWTLIATYLRNLLLNWLVIVPLMLAALAVPRLVVALLVAQPPQWAMQGALVLGMGLAVVGIAFVGVHRPSLNRYRTGQRAFLQGCLLPLVGSAAALGTYWSWAGGVGGTGLELPAFLGFGVVVRLASWALYAALLRRRRVWAELPMVLAIGALGGALFWVVATVFFPDPVAQVEAYACLVVPLLLGTFAATGTVFIGLTSHAANDVDPEWWARFGAWILIVAVGWGLVSGIVVYGPLLLLALSDRGPSILVSLGSVSGAAVVAAGGGARTPGAAGTPQVNAVATGWQTRALVVAEMLAAPVFTLVLITGLSLLTTHLVPAAWTATAALGGTPVAGSGAEGHLEVLRRAPLEAVALLIGASAALGLLLALFVDINKLSLHSMYRSRLIRAYLGASRLERDPNPFTGFDQDDDLPIHDLREAGEGVMQRPMHVVNITLNVVSGTRRAWQQRKSESFTVTPLHCGSRSLGYRRAEQYGGPAGMSLGTAVAVSGAAASPNVGYNSSPFVAFLLALFNARLGWWLGNPGPAGEETYKAQGPLMAISPLIQEAFGLINERCKYVFLSDGGHYENLGLYEMVLRRCHVIVVSDAGRDTGYTFEALANAIRKVRIDLGIPIELGSIPIYGRKGERTGRYSAVGTIRYSQVDGPGTDGVLIYVKPVVYGNEPTDVYHYAQANPEFPQESTSDQWFNEAQFESYRMLGLHAIRQACGEHEAGGNLTELAERLRAAPERLRAAPEQHAGEVLSAGGGTQTARLV